MGRRSAKAATAELKTTIRELADEMEAGDDAELTIREIENEIDQTPDDVRWNVHVSRVKANSKYEPFLFSCDPSEMAGLRERLRDRYGTGLYRVRVRKNGQIARQYDLAVETETAAVQALSGTSGLEEIIRRQFELMESRFAKLEERSQPNGTDDLTRFKVMAEILRGSPQQQAAASSSMTEMLGFFTAALKLGQELGGAGGDSGVVETNFADVLKEAVKSGGLERIGEALTAFRRPAIVQEPQAVAAIAPPGGEVQGIMDARPQNALQMQDKRTTATPAAAMLIGPVLASEMQKLIAAAKRGSSPALYAEYLSDSLPDPAMAYILNNDRVLAYLEKAFPEVASVRDWFQALLTEILQMNSEEGQGAANIPGDDTGRPGGDRRNPQDHAPNGTDVAPGTAN